ncbi:lycopene cyclase domain-containing protein [Microbacterium sp. LWH10-1.2]|uniref:lycopene cyclase domain-containing protein n=1 Tax=unclassified Microbacterium TaxID=2609290 RepID=UPI00313A3616
MTGLIYLGALLVSAGCLVLVDRRYRLFFWRDPLSALVVTVVGAAFFLAWDAAGIATGLFLRGDATIATGLVLAPEMPIEEPVFLLFLVQCIMIAYTGAARILSRRARSTRGEEPS